MWGICTKLLVYFCRDPAMASRAFRSEAADGVYLTHSLVLCLSHTCTHTQTHIQIHLIHIFILMYGFILGVDISAAETLVWAACIPY